MTLQIVEVSARDGIQNESTLLRTEEKLELIARCVAAGARRVEVTSFVNPRLVPQMADSEDVMGGVDRSLGVSYAGLVMNQRGLERALASHVDEVNYVLVATDTFSQRNQGCTTEEGIQRWADMASDLAGSSTLRTVTIGAAFGCPFEGEVVPERIAELVERVAEIGVDEIALADTIGVGVPADVRVRLGTLLERTPGVRTRLHLHNTRNTGYANALTALDMGIGALDASLGGIGGCPFAPNATGNIATEDLVYQLQRSGIDPGMDLSMLMDGAVWIGELLGIQSPGLLSRAGAFPSGGEND